jgi:hypothetical protein
MLRSNLLPLSRSEKTGCKDTTTFCFYAPGTRRARSWPRPLQIRKAIRPSPPSVPAVIPPEAFAPRRCGNWKRRTSPRLAFAARVGTSSPGQALPRIDFIFTVCDRAANEVCPVWPGQPTTAPWGIPDPAAVQGTREQVEKAFREAFFLLDRRISLLLSLPLSTLDRFSLKKEIDNIGRQ